VSLAAVGLEVSVGTITYVRLSWEVIISCWAAWAALWIALAFRSKRTVERADGVWLRSVFGGLAVTWIVIVLVAGDSLHRELWHWSPVAGAVAVTLVVAGLAFSVWARVTLGGNWSGLITFKAHHELVQTGPYAIVRHPIYTGVLAMLLGTALNLAEPIGVAYVVLVVIVFFAKARREEQLMDTHFPDTYGAYRRRTKAIIPFVL
jgi:protein-S-isoprenylcysteine O-methyltransferase Ste14